MKNSEKTDNNSLELDPVVFGKMLKIALTHKQMSQLDLSHLLGCTEKTVSKWQRGESFPNLRYFFEICKTLELQPNFFANIPSRKENADTRTKDLTRKELTLNIDALITNLTINVNANN